MLKPRFDIARRSLALGVIAFGFTSCTGEEPVPIDLNSTVPPTTAAADENDPNAAQRQEIQQLAEQQCLDDPDLEEGTVRIVDPATDEIVSELIIPCSEVR